MSPRGHSFAWVSSAGPTQSDNKADEAGGPDAAVPPSCSTNDRFIRPTRGRMGLGMCRASRTEPTRCEPRAPRFGLVAHATRLSDRDGGPGVTSHMDRANGPVQSEAEATPPRDQAEDFHSLVLASRRLLLETAARALGDGVGLGLITGAAGSGKSWLASRLPSPALDDHGSSTSPTPVTFPRLVVEIHPATRPRDLLARILHQLGDPTPANDTSAPPWDEASTSSSCPQGDLPCRMADLLIDQASEGRRWSLFVEEAQNLTPATAEVIRVLSNRIARPDGFASIWLIGQTPLIRFLRTRPYQPLETRLGCHLQLPPLTPEEARQLLAARWPETNWHQPILERLLDEAHANPRALLSLAAREYHRLPRVETFGARLPWLRSHNEIGDTPAPSGRSPAPGADEACSSRMAASPVAGQPEAPLFGGGARSVATRSPAPSASSQVAPQVDELPRLLAEWFRDASGGRPGTGIRIGDHSVEVGWGVGSDSDAEGEEEVHLPSSTSFASLLGESEPLETDTSPEAETPHQSSPALEPTPLDAIESPERIRAVELGQASASAHVYEESDEDELESVRNQPSPASSPLWNRSPSSESIDLKATSDSPIFGHPTFAGGEVVGEEVVMDRYALIQAQNEWRLGGDLERAWKANQVSVSSRDRNPDPSATRSHPDDQDETTLDSPSLPETKTAPGPIRDVQPIGPGSRFGPTIWREEQQSFAPYGRLFHGRSSRGRE